MKIPKNTRIHFTKVRNALLRPYLNQGMNGISVATRIMNRRIKMGSLPKEFLMILAEERKKNLLKTEARRRLKVKNSLST